MKYEVAGSWWKGGRCGCERTHEGAIYPSLAEARAAYSVLVAGAPQEYAMAGRWLKDCGGYYVVELVAWSDDDAQGLKSSIDMHTEGGFDA